MPPPRRAKNRLVYSSERGVVGESRSERARDDIVQVSRSSKGRRGKGVTVITGIPLQGDALKALARQLKQKCGSGGTVKGDVVEIQGDARDPTHLWKAMACRLVRTDPPRRNVPHHCC